jgi:hypothetical protein
MVPDAILSRTLRNAIANVARQRGEDYDDADDAPPSRRS